MCADIVHYVTPLRKSYMTNITKMKLFTCMRSEVLLQDASLRKSFVTNLTNMKFFYIYESEVGILSWVLEKIHSCKAHKCNLLAFYLCVLKMVSRDSLFQKILFIYFTKLRLFACLCLNMALNIHFLKIFCCIIHKQEVFTSWYEES